MSDSQSPGAAGAPPRVRSIDPKKLPKHFDAPSVESQWDER